MQIHLLFIFWQIWGWWFTCEAQSHLWLTYEVLCAFYIHPKNTSPKYEMANSNFYFVYSHSNPVRRNFGLIFRSQIRERISSIWIRQEGEQCQSTTLKFHTFIFFRFLIFNFLSYGWNFTPTSWQRIYSLQMPSIFI